MDKSVDENNSKKITLQISYIDDDGNKHTTETNIALGENAQTFIEDNGTIKLVDENGNTIPVSITTNNTDTTNEDDGNEKIESSTSKETSKSPYTFEDGLNGFANVDENSKEILRQEWILISPITTIIQELGQDEFYEGGLPLNNFMGELDSADKLIESQGNFYTGAVTQELTAIGASKQKEINEVIEETKAFSKIKEDFDPDIVKTDIHKYNDNLEKAIIKVCIKILKEKCKEYNSSIIPPTGPRRRDYIMPIPREFIAFQDRPIFEGQEILTNRMQDRTRPEFQDRKVPRRIEFERFFTGWENFVDMKESELVTLMLDKGIDLTEILAIQRPMDT